MAGGCFWCLEAVFKELKGVDKVISGYSGGSQQNPSYQDMPKPDNTHAETVEISYNPEIISYKKILEVFYSIHDPTTLNRQGNDVGKQYRSAIFYHNDEQKEIAETVTKNYAAQLWNNPIVTEISKYTKFWQAENAHQNYFENNPGNPYCQVIINPKLDKFRKKYHTLLK